LIVSILIKKRNVRALDWFAFWATPQPISREAEVILMRMVFYI